MIVGTVQSDEARIRLKVKGPRGAEQEIDAVIDTGFTATLTLPPALIEALGLRWQCLDRGTLADGSDCLFDVYGAEVVWGSAVAFGRPARRRLAYPRAFDRM